jgi:hypothetical protein
MVKKKEFAPEDFTSIEDIWPRSPPGHRPSIQSQIAGRKGSCSVAIAHGPRVAVVGPACRAGPCGPKAPARPSIPFRQKGSTGPHSAAGRLSAWASSGR